MASEKKRAGLQIVAVRAKKIKYYEVNPEKLNIDPGDVKGGKCNIVTGVTYDHKKSNLIEIRHEADFNSEIKKKSEKVFGIVSEHTFLVKDLKKVVKKTKAGQYFIPESILIELLKMSVSGTRGMLSVLVKRYKSANLPLIDLSELAKGLNKNAVDE